MKNISLKSFLLIAIISAFAFETVSLFNDFETKNFKGNNVTTSSIQDKIILLHTISSKSTSYKVDISLYKEIQDIYVKAFFDRYAKKGLFVITVTDKVIDEQLIPNSEFTFISNNKVIKEFLKKHNLSLNGSNLIINGKREIVHTNVPNEKLKSTIGSLLTRDRLEINYFD